MGAWWLCFAPANTSELMKEGTSELVRRAGMILVMRVQEVAELGISAGPVGNLQS